MCAGQIRPEEESVLCKGRAGAASRCQDAPDSAAEGERAQKVFWPYTDAKEP